MNNGELSADLYAYALDSKEPNNYTTIPNIIDHLTYDEVDSETGNTIIKRLSVFAIHLYRILKNIAGQENICWKNTQHLAEIANMSVGQVSKCKKELQQKFHQLDGNPLILIEEKEKIIRNGDVKINGTKYHLVKIVNIWGWNRAFFLSKKLLGKQKAHSPHERADPAHSPHERAPPEARSPHERNNITDNKNPLFLEQTSTSDDVSVCSLDKSENVVCSSQTDLKTQAFNYFVKLGCDIRTAVFFTETYSIEDIQKASKYVTRQIEIKKKQNKTLDNIIGYFRKTLAGRYWESKTV